MLLQTALSTPRILFRGIRFVVDQFPSTTLRRAVPASIMRQKPLLNIPGKAYVKLSFALF